MLTPMLQLPEQCNYRSVPWVDKKERGEREVDQHAYNEVGGRVTMVAVGNRRGQREMVA